MFFKRRVLQAEYFDAIDRPDSELAEAYAMLSVINRLCLLARQFQKLLPGMLGEERCHSLSLLDLGAGDGWLGNELSRWAAKRGWDWRVTNLDLNARALERNPRGRNVAGSALSLPFRDDAFDMVIASQMAHHLETDGDVCRHFQEAWRVAREGIVLNDLHRNAAFYAALWVLLHLQRAPRHFVCDGLLSIRRGWRVAEWRALAARAEIPNPRVWLSAGARVILTARKNS
jgi:2-polyprenyl-3-methyl-5-hydroxy-6-metoxy-1,4-benzoquinol methylase